MEYDEQQNNPYAYFEDTLDFQAPTGVSALGDQEDSEPRTPFEIRCLWKKWPLTRPASVIVTKDELTVMSKGLLEPVVIPRRQAAEVVKVKRDCLKFSEFYHPLRKLLFDKKLYGEKKEKQLLNIVRLTVWMEPQGTPEEMAQRVYERIRKRTVQTTGLFLSAILILLAVFSTFLDLGNPYDFQVVRFYCFTFFATAFLLWGRMVGSSKIIAPGILFFLFASVAFLVLSTREDNRSDLVSYYFIGIFTVTFIEFLLLPGKIRRLENRFQLENDVDDS